MTSADIIAKLVEYGVPLGDALILAAVGYAESGYQPEIAGDGGDSIGLFQINTPAHGNKLLSATGSNNLTDWEEWLKIPANNIYMAAQVYHSQGLGAWTCYKTGAYQAYLGQDLTVKDYLAQSTMGAGDTSEPSLVSADGLQPTADKVTDTLAAAKDKVTGFFKNGLYAIVGLVFLVLGTVIIIKTPAALPAAGAEREATA